MAKLEATVNVEFYKVYKDNRFLCKTKNRNEACEFCQTHFWKSKPPVVSPNQEAPKAEVYELRLYINKKCVSKELYTLNIVTKRKYEKY